MKRLLKANASLQALCDYIKGKTALVEGPLLDRLKLQHSSTRRKPTKEQAVKTIIHAWHGYKIKKTIVQSPYFSYLSLIDPKNEQRILSSIMFGRHAAEIKPGSMGRIDNAFIAEQAHYHRDDDISSLLLESLLTEFNTPLENTTKYDYIPLTNLHNTPLQELLARHIPNYVATSLVTDANHTISLLAIPKDNPDSDTIKRTLRAYGVIASPWDIAANITSTSFTIPKPDSDKTDKLTLDPSLPKTKKELLESQILTKLNQIAGSRRHATHKLATCLMKMLRDLPDLSPEAIQRIALMLDMTNTFYEHNYPRFTFCVYAIVHEISLAHLKQQDPETLEKQYTQFLAESKSSLVHSLGLENQPLENSTFIATPAMSGTNAYAIAMQLANKMTTLSGGQPTVSIQEPCYYEFHSITKQTSYTSKADIIVMSGGPIFGQDGITPGIDINRFVERHFIAKKRDKPMTLVVDATSMLYKNLKLEPAVKALVESGKLSIIVHESHQKFGLIHTDQAQYGRMFGLCAKGSFAESAIKEIQTNSKKDFDAHVDMRIGAYISSTCGDTLEEIKQQHFTNGALLRNILVQSSLAQKSVVKHEDMLKNLDELYFLTFAKEKEKEKLLLWGKTSKRDSFGHFSSTLSTILDKIRLSPDASDDIDCLIQASQIYLAQHFTPEQTLTLLEKFTTTPEDLSLDQQVILLAMLNQIISNENSIKKIYAKNTYEEINNALKHCPLLKGRQYALRVENFLLPFNPDYFKALEILERQHIKPSNANQRLMLDSPHFNPGYFKALEILEQQHIKPSNANQRFMLDSPDFVTCILDNKSAMNKLKFNASAAIIEHNKNDYAKYLTMCENRTLCKMIIKLFDTNQKILSHLSYAPEKQATAIAHAPLYLTSCLNALKTFSEVQIPSTDSKHQLVDSLNGAKNDYCNTILSKDTERKIRLLLKIFINGLAALSLGLIHAAHYARTGRATFFSGTTSELKLKDTHKGIERNIGKL